LKLVGLSILSLMRQGRLLETFIPNYDVPCRYLNKLDLGWWKWFSYLVFYYGFLNFLWTGLCYWLRKAWKKVYI